MYVEQFRAKSTKYAKRVMDSRKDATFSACCVMHTNLARGSPVVEGMDFYGFLRSTSQALVVGGQAPKNLVDTRDEIPCGISCPKMY